MGSKELTKALSRNTRSNLDRSETPTSWSSCFRRVITFWLPERNFLSVFVRMAAEAGCQLWEFMQRRWLVIAKRCLHKHSSTVGRSL